MNRTLKQTAAFAAFGKGIKGRLVVNAARAAEDPVEILLIGPVGASWWSPEGIRQKEVIEAIDAVPVGRKIIIGVNSTGGSVEDGLGIYAAIRRRSADITVRIDGYACSIASVFPLAASRVITPKASIWMIHNAWNGAIGNASDMRKEANALDKHDSALVAVYAEHTGKTREECMAAMDAETWFTGEEAHAWGLASEMSDDEIELEPIESSPFACVPPSLVLAYGRPLARLEPLNAFRRVSPPKSAARHQSDARSNTETIDPPMNRIAILALLKKHGATLPDNATDAELNAEGLKLITAGKITLPEWSAASTPPAAATPPPAAAAGADDLARRLAAVESQNADLRRADVTRRVDLAISERRIPNAAREFWIGQGVANAGVLDQLASYPQQHAGEAPVVEVTGDDPVNVLSGIRGLRRPVEAFRRGEDVPGNEIRDAALSIGRIMAQHRTRLSGPLAATTHTIDADLKRVVILSDVMRAFRRRLMPLGAFSTVFTGIPFNVDGGTDEFVVPFYDLDTGASTDWNGTDGYLYAGTTAAGKRKVPCNKRKYQSMDFGSDLLARQPYFNPAQTLLLKAEKLAEDVFSDVLSVVTAANFPLTPKTSAADAFDYEDVVDFRVAGNQNKWPVGGRSLFMESEYDGALTKDDRVVRVDASGTDAAIRRGSVGMIAGFETFENPSIPQNGAENVKGFASFTSAILVGVSPIEPAPGVRHLLRSYEVITDPDTGISFSYRYGGNSQKDRDESVVEVAYGYGPGNEKALIRLVKP